MIKPSPPLQILIKEETKKAPLNTSLADLLKLFPDTCHNKIFINSSSGGYYREPALIITHNREVPNPKYEEELAKYKQNILKYNQELLQNAENNLKIKEKEVLKYKKRLEDLKIGISYDEYPRFEF